MSARIFRVLGACVREVDFVGWHREGTVAGAVIRLGNHASADARRLLAERVGKALMGQLPKDHSTRLRVRVVCLGGKVRH